VVLAEMHVDRGPARRSRRDPCAAEIAQHCPLSAPRHQVLLRRPSTMAEASSRLQHLISRSDNLYLATENLRDSRHFSPIFRHQAEFQKLGAIQHKSVVERDLLVNDAMRKLMR
jgi:hypothetical protein